MKRLVLITCLILAPCVAFADDAKPAPKPTCGKTIEECQTKVDADAQTIKELNAAVAGARQQRDAAAQAQADAQLQSYIAQQAPKPAK